MSTETIHDDVTSMPDVEIDDPSLWQFVPTFAEDGIFLTKLVVGRWTRGDYLVWRVREPAEITEAEFAEFCSRRLRGIDGVVLTLAEKSGD